MANPRLLYIINHMDWFWSHRLPLAKGALEQGWQVDVAAAGASRDQNLTANGFTGHEIPAGDSGFAPFTALKLIFAIRTLIRQTRPDLVHAITLKYVFLAGLAVRLCPGVRVVHTVAGLGYLFSGEDRKARVLRLIVSPFLKLALNHAGALVIVQNPEDRDLLIKRGFVKAERCHLIRGSGVDTAQFAYVPEPENSVPRVVMPTRLVHDKGVAVFVEAARLLKKRGVPAKFQIAGGLSAHNPLAIKETEMHEMTADGAAEWLGKVTDMPTLYASSTLIVYPSYYGEGVPKVLLEAAATGRAIVTTDHPGCREAVSHGENGLLVPIKNAEKTADAVQKLLENHGMRAEMGRKSREKAENEFDVRIIVAKTLEIYKKSLQN